MASKAFLAVEKHCVTSIRHSHNCDLDAWPVHTYKWLPSALQSCGYHFAIFSDSFSRKSMRKLAGQVVNCCHLLRWPPLISGGWLKQLPAERNWIFICWMEKWNLDPDKLLFHTGKRIKLRWQGEKMEFRSLSIPCWRLLLHMEKAE